MSEQPFSFNPKLEEAQKKDALRLRSPEELKDRLTKIVEELKSKPEDNQLKEEKILLEEVLAEKEK